MGTTATSASGSADGACGAGLRVLLLDDSSLDAELELRALARQGVALSQVVVCTGREEYVARLQDFEPDVILSDYSLPDLHGEEALELALRHCPQTPFVIVSGVVGGAGGRPAEARSVGLRPQGSAGQARASSAGGSSEGTTGEGASGDDGRARSQRGADGLSAYRRELPGRGNGRAPAGRRATLDHGQRRPPDPPWSDQAVWDRDLLHRHHRASARHPRTRGLRGTLPARLRRCSGRHGPPRRRSRHTGSLPAGQPGPVRVLRTRRGSAAGNIRPGPLRSPGRRGCADLARGARGRGSGELPGRAAVRACDRRPSMGDGQYRPGPRSGRRTAVRPDADRGHHRPQAGGERSDLPCTARRPHRASQPGSVAGSHQADPADVGIVAERIQDSLAAEIPMQGQVFTAPASIGIALSDESSTPETLLRDADSAMYVAKRRGGRRWEPANASLHAAAVRAVTVGGELREALAQGQLRVHYQPIYDLRAQTVVAAETLVRWQHPKRGLLLPGDFLDVAEQRGLIGEIGTMVLRSACEQAARWRRQFGPRAPTVAVNIASSQLGNGALNRLVEELLATLHLPPAQLRLEITESQLVSVGSSQVADLCGVAETGVWIAVDDFGTGFAGFEYLRRLPVNELKIDLSFVSGLNVDPTDTAITASVIALGRSLGLTVVAEGIATQEQLQTLCGLGCPWGQGWLWSRAVPAKELNQLLSRDPHQVVADDP